MPTYEYRCASCNLKSSFFIRSMSTQLEAICSHCGSHDMQRVISAVSFRVSSRGASDSTYFSDPSNIGRRVEDGFKRYGVDMPDSVRETIDEARQGKMPEGLDI